MKKDYIPISDEQCQGGEDTFVEDFWTQRWDKNVELPKPDSVEKREEFQLMQPFLRTLPPDSRILDGGCGMGEWTVFLTNQGFQGVGLDISKRTITRLQELLPTYRFATGDIRHTEFDDASFDAYFSWGTFEHFENGLAECVQEAYRILKPGGYLFVSVPYQNLRHVRQGSQWKNKNAPLPQSEAAPPTSIRFYQWRLTRSELAQELGRQGFHVLDIVPIQKKHGLKRTLHHDFGIKKGTTRHRKMTHYLQNIIPANWVAHMIMGIAQKIE